MNVTSGMFCLVILIKTCSESTYGCCPDGKTSAQGPHNAGCPSVCNCNRLGSYGLTCDPVTNQCFCKPGVGGPRCDRCEPGYWGLHKITEESNDGCSPCACTLYGSARDDCEQMTGRCVCKFGIKGMKCDICPTGTVLGRDGCMDESIAEPVSGSCADLVCHHGAECRETEEGLAQCVCDVSCSPDDNKDRVCGSDGNTYGSECQMKLFRCRYQKRITVVSRTACPKDVVKTDSANLKRFRRRGQLRFLGKSHQRHSPRSLKYKEDSISSLSPDYLRKKPIFNRIEFELGFTSNKTDGLLFFASSNEKKNIYISLSIRKRFLELRLQGLSGSAILKSSNPISLHTYHRVLFRCFSHFTVLYLDSKWVDMKARKETFRISDELQNYYVGSVPISVQRNKNQQEFISFSGFIHFMKVYCNESSNLGIQFFTSQNQSINTLTNLSFPRKTSERSAKIESADDLETRQTSTPINHNTLPLLTWIQQSHGVMKEIQIILLEKKIQVKALVNGSPQCKIKDLIDISKTSKNSLKLIIFNKSIELFEFHFINKKNKSSVITPDVSPLTQSNTSITFPCECFHSVMLNETSLELTLPITLDCASS